MILVMAFRPPIMAPPAHTTNCSPPAIEYRSIYESQTKNQAQPEERAAAEQAAESSTAEPSGNR